MSSSRAFLGATIAIALGAASCSKTPDVVLSKDDMASLLVDIHKGEGVVDLQRGRYYNDSLRKVMKQSIFEAHGVTQEQVDTSFVWYGNHIEEYIEVYDEVIARLEAERDEEIRAGKMAPVFAEGDSVDVWPGSPMYKFTSDMPMRNIVFALTQDDSWEPGDNYVLQFKIVSAKDKNTMGKGSIFAEYETGDVEYRVGDDRKSGWGRVKLYSDTTKLLSALYGNLRFEVAEGEDLFVDSVALIRTRMFPKSYNQRTGQRRIAAPKVSVEESTDSIATDPNE